MPTVSWVEIPVRTSTVREDGSIVLQRGVRLRQVTAEHLLADFLGLPAAPLADLRGFLVRYGWPRSPVGPEEVLALARAAQNLLTLTDYLRSRAGRRPEAAIRDLMAWVHQHQAADAVLLEHRYRAREWRSDQAIEIDLTHYPLAEWRTGLGEPPGLTFRPVGEYHLPADLELLGPDAIAAWVGGEVRWKGVPGSAKHRDVIIPGERRAAVARERRHGFPAYLRECDELLWGFCSAVWLDWCPVPRLVWDGGPTWRSGINNVVGAIALEVVRSCARASTLCYCRTCGSVFAGSGARGRPRSECDTCYDPTTSRRRAARRSNKARKLAPEGRTKRGGSGTRHSRQTT